MFRQLKIRSKSPGCRVSRGYNHIWQNLGLFLHTETLDIAYPFPRDLRIREHFTILKIEAF